MLKKYFEDVLRRVILCDIMAKNKRGRKMSRPTKTLVVVLLLLLFVIVGCGVAVVDANEAPLLPPPPPLLSTSFGVLGSC